MPTLRVDDEVYEALKKLAEPFVDSPNSVIRRLLEEHGHVEKKKPTPTAAVAKSNPELEPTPQAVYEELLLKVLDEQFKGRGDKRSVTHAIVEKMQKQKLLRAADLELVATGETRAENAIAWGRNALKDRGLLNRNSRRGIWELTPEGKATAKKI
jgi:predicted CopG family antitoxin